MSKRNPVYTPMCNKHIRFYLSNTERTTFTDSLSEKQFMAVEKVFKTLNPEQRSILESIMPMQEKTTSDLMDSYIMNNLRKQKMSIKEIDEFWIFLRYVNRLIAVEMGYIEDAPGKDKQWK